MGTSAHSYPLAFRGIIKRRKRNDEDDPPSKAEGSGNIIVSKAEI
jgi:hypothetical protein